MYKGGKDKGVALNSKNESFVIQKKDKFSRIAWRYFEKYMHSTGLVQSTNSYPCLTLWDVANEILGLMAARDLNIISSFFYACISKIMNSLKSLTLCECSGYKLPNRVYRADTLQPTDESGNVCMNGCGWSSTDIGHLLIVLDKLSNNHPRFVEEVNEVVSRWDLGYAVKNRCLYGYNSSFGLFDESMYPYGMYASRGFELYGFRIGNRPLHKSIVYGRDIYWDDYGMTTTEPFLLHTLLNDGMPWLEGSFYDILAVQVENFRYTGVFTSASESPLDVEPYYVYHCILAGFEEAKCIPFVTIADGKVLRASQLTPVSLRCAVAADVIDKENFWYWNLITASGLSRLSSENGFLAGFYTTLYPILTADINTNALILNTLSTLEK